MLQGNGKFFCQEIGHRLIAYVHISAYLVRDSQFPFKHKDVLKVEVDPERKALVLTLASEEKSARSNNENMQVDAHIINLKGTPATI